MKAMAAKFNGKCRGCGGRIEAGDQILWSKASGALHGECFAGANEVRYHDAATDAAMDDAELRAEGALIEREEREYLQGYHEMKQIQAFAPAGSLLREAMYLEMEMAAYNRGEDY